MRQTTKIAAAALVSVACAAPIVPPRPVPTTLRGQTREEAINADRWWTACATSENPKCIELKRHLLEAHDWATRYLAQKCELFEGAAPAQVLQSLGEPDDDNRSLESAGVRTWVWNWHHVGGAAAFSVYWLQGPSGWTFNECRICEASLGVGGCHRLPFGN